MNKTLTGIVAAAALAVSVPSLAQNWYSMVGVGYGDANFNGNDLGLSNGTVDNHDTTYSLRLGYDVNKYFALEMGYADLGKYPFSGYQGATLITGSAKANSFDVSVVGTWPFTPEFAGYGRLGVARSERKANANTATLTADQSITKTEATYGVGVRYAFDRAWGMYGEWSKNDQIKVDNYTIGVLFRF
jgi:OmpA-OmpF porin, OOP family